VGGDAASRLGVGQLQDRVGGAAQLEGTGGVQVLGLEVHLGTDPRIDGARPQHGRRRHEAGDAGGRRLHVLEGRSAHSSVA
jgi:hypothetical protein